jgi:hypothetical protein
MVNSWLFGSIGIVKNTTGVVEIKRVNEVIVVMQGTLLERNDIIKTKANSSIGIIFDDGSAFSFGETAIISVNEYEFNPAKEKYNMDITVEKGKAVFSSGKVGKIAPESVKIRTPKGVVGIRGTRFAVEVK